MISNLVEVIDYLSSLMTALILSSYSEAIYILADRDSVYSRIQVVIKGSLRITDNLLEWSNLGQQG